MVDDGGWWILLGEGCMLWWFVRGKVGSEVYLRGLVIWFEGF